MDWAPDFELEPEARNRAHKQVVGDASPLELHVVEGCTARRDGLVENVRRALHQRPLKLGSICEFARTENGDGSWSLHSFYCVVAQFFTN